MVTAHDEDTTSGSAAGHFTLAPYEAMNLAPFGTSFSMKLMVSWHFYSQHGFYVIIQYNYIQ